MWAIIWNAITGNIAGIVKVILSYLGKLSDRDLAKFQTVVGADRDVAIAQLQTASAVYHDRVDLLKGMKITQWLIAAALVPVLIHQGAVIFDSTPFPYLSIHDWVLSIKTHDQGSWQVFSLPSPYDQREGTLIASLLGIQGATTLGLGLIKSLISRK